MPLGYVIRYAQTNNIPQLQEVDVWPKERDWKHKISASEVVVAVSESTLVGHLRFDMLWSTVPFLAMIFVAPEYRGQGISR